MAFNHPLEPATTLITSLFPAYLLAGVIYVWATRLRFRVSYDPLMMIYNRATCDQLISDGTNGSLGENFNIAMVDVDHFKKFNDRYGHAVGDEVLHQVAQTIRSESLPQGLCCRYGGEEIIVFLRRSDPGQGTKVFEKIRKSVQDMSMKSGRRRIRVTVSIGWVAVKRSTKKSLSDYVKKADKALYRAKAGGRNKVVRDN